MAALALVIAACGSGGETTASEPAVEPSVTPPEAVAEDAPEPPPTPTPAPPTPTPLPVRATIDDLLAQAAPVSLAHAGGDQDAPHSTMFAFKEAVAVGVDVLELDVQLSGDGVVIVHHDATVDGTTDGTGLVLDHSLDQLQALDNAYWFAEECWPCRDLPEDSYLYRGVRSGETSPPAGYTPEDFRIVTFRELVEEFPQMPFDIEIKGEPPEALAVVDVLAPEIAALDVADSVVVVSFSDEVVTAFEAAAPGVETSPGTAELTAWVLADTPLEGHRIVQVPPEFQGLEVVNEEFIALAAEAGVEVWVWPSDAASQENTAFYRQMLDLGADGIIAGRPAAMEAARS